MTVLVALQQDEGVYVGSDSLTLSHWHLKRSGDVKIIEKDGFVIAVTGRSLVGQAIRHHWSAPERRHDQDAEEYVCERVGGSLLKTLKSQNAAFTDNEESEARGALLFAFEGLLFSFSTDGYIGRHHDYAAEGCGMEFAYGSLHATAHTKLSARRRVDLAVKAAGHFSAFCDSQPRILFQARPAREVATRTKRRRAAKK